MQRLVRLHPRHLLACRASAAPHTSYMSGHQSNRESHPPSRKLDTRLSVLCKGAVRKRPAARQESEAAEIVWRGLNLDRTTMCRAVFLLLRPKELPRMVPSHRPSRSKEEVHMTRKALARSPGWRGVRLPLASRCSRRTLDISSLRRCCLTLS